MSTDIVNLPDGEIITPQRDSHGRMLPGFSTNPTGKNAGRPRIRFISEALNKRLDDEGQAQVLADKLLEHAKNGKPSVSIAAIDMIADRVEGKPIQQHRIEQALDAETMRKLTVLAERIT